MSNVFPVKFALLPCVTYSVNSNQLILLQIRNYQSLFIYCYLCHKWLHWWIYKRLLSEISDPVSNITQFSESGWTNNGHGDYQLKVQDNDPCSCGHNNWLVNIRKQIFSYLPSKYYRAVACTNILRQQIGESITTLEYIF